MAKASARPVPHEGEIEERLVGSREVEEALGSPAAATKPRRPYLARPVLVAMRDEEGDVDAADAAKRIEPTAGERPGQAVVGARHVAYRGEGRDHTDVRVVIPLHRRPDRINMAALERTTRTRVLTGSRIGILIPTRRRCTRARS